MHPCVLFIAVLLPIVSALLLRSLKLNNTRGLHLYLGGATLLTSVLVWGLILSCPEDSFRLISFADSLTLTLRFDGLGRFFAGIVATLWPLTVLYAFEYMKDDERAKTFFTFFTLAYGVTLGICMAGNLFTMYCFYEFLTLTTVPLVMHPRTKAAIRAARTYFAVSLGGAAFAFASMIFLIANGADGNFALGGLLKAYPYAKPYITKIFYCLGFFGFGVKAALFPVDGWLPKASVAPTPVTALLHAVAVVKSGAFAIFRLTYYCYGTAPLKGTWAQNVVISFAIFTVLYGSSRALKDGHWKRRLAWSTVGNLSYILFGAAMMTNAGFAAGLLHMAFHAEIKILAFFCAGAVLHQTGREYVRDLDGLGKKLPVTFACFTASALALIGIPPLSGFVSKWHLLTAAADSENPLAYVGAGVLLVSALLTAIYMLTTVRRAWFPGKDADLSSLSGLREANLKMTIPMALLAVAILLTGIFSQPILQAIEKIVCGG